MKKNYFNLRKMIAIAISLAALTIFSACGEEEPTDPNGTEEPGTDPGTDPGTNPAVWTLTEQTAFSDNTSIWSIAYGDNKFVAGGTNRKMAYSTDGINWTAIANTGLTIMEAPGNNTVLDITYGNGKFVAVGGGNQMSYSTDGINWTRVANTGFLPSPSLSANYDATNITGIAYGNGKFVIAGYCNSFGNKTEWGAQLAYSTDGINWTAADATILGFGPASSYPVGVITIEYVNDRFVATSDGNNGILASSTDGINWTLGGSPLPAGNMGLYYQVLGIAYGADKFVVGGTGDRIAYSTDCVNWTNGSAKPLGSNANVRQITFANGKFIAVGDHNKTAQSTDGINWTEINNVPYSGTAATALYDIAYGAGKFVAVGFTGNPAKPVIMYCNN